MCRGKRVPTLGAPTWQHVATAPLCGFCSWSPCQSRSWRAEGSGDGLKSLQTQGRGWGALCKCKSWARGGGVRLWRLPFHAQAQEVGG